MNRAGFMEGSGDSSPGLSQHCTLMERRHFGEPLGYLDVASEPLFLFVGHLRLVPRMSAHEILHSCAELP
jgi:hypothetical protein